MNKPEEWTLFEKLDEGSITEEEFNQLQERLKEDAELRKTYRAYMDMVSAIQDMSDNEAEGAWTKDVNIVTPRKTPKKLVLYTAINIAALLLFAFLIINADNTKGDTEEELLGLTEDRFESGYARINQVVAVEWDEQVYHQGAFLNDQRVKLKEGLVNLEFENGVDIIIEGPADFQLLSPMKMHLYSGKVKANVPEAGHGFTIETEQVDVVDLGTEFGIEVTDAKVDVQVIDGLVKLQENQNDLQEINAGQAFEVNKDKIIKKLDFNPAKFKGHNELRVIKKTLVNKAYQRWINYAQELRHDPDLIAYYYFINDGAYRRQVPNQKTDADASTFGVTKHIKRDLGRFHSDELRLERSAFDFNNNLSRMNIDLPGKMDALTMMCWINITSVDNHFNTLIESKSHSPGAIGWYIRKQTMFVNLHRPSGNTFVKSTESIQTPKTQEQGIRGNWFHFTVRITKDKISFFMNGIQAYENENTVDYDYLEIGQAEIGNSYAQARRRQLPLNFHGKMDEFLIFKSALSNEKIQEIYKQGNYE